MRSSHLRSLVLFGAILAWAPGLRAEGEAGAVDLRGSEARATTPYNQQVVEQFRATDGKPGGREGLLLLHTTGAKTGKKRLTPLAYMPEGDGLVIIASFGGAPKHPAWYHNLVANPRVGVEVGAKQYYATARVTEEPERTALFDKMAAKAPAFAKYEERAKPRVIPVIVLNRVP